MLPVNSMARAALIRCLPGIRVSVENEHDPRRIDGDRETVIFLSFEGHYLDWPYLTLQHVASFADSESVDQKSLGLESRGLVMG